MKPTLLDLFCCQGGAAVGYAEAGYTVIGVDNRPQSRYPFKVIRSDALTFLDKHGEDFDAIHASPPCQEHSVLASLANDHGTEHLLHDTITMLSSRFAHKPYIIENVMAAKMETTVVLCGSMFGLGSLCCDGQYRYLMRHRRFLSNVDLEAPGPCQHNYGMALGVYGGGHRLVQLPGKNWDACQPEAKRALGTYWMNRRGMAQAIPPAYTKWLGSQIIKKEVNA